MLFCLVENNTVTLGPAPLPTNWNNISNFSSLESDLDYLLSLGWYKFVAVGKPQFDKHQYKLVASYDIQADGVYDSYELIALTQEEKDQMAIQEAQDLVDLKKKKIDDINKGAGESRSKYITVIPGQEATYMMKEEEANNYVLNPQGSYPMLQAEATACSTTVEAIATLVIQTASQWRTLASYIEGLRRGSIVSVENATSEEEVSSVNPVWP